MRIFLKGIVELGITPDVPSDTRRGIRLVNSLSFITGISAVILAPLLTAITHQPIMWPGFLEAAAFMLSLYLNYKKHYFLSALCMLITQNLAAVYFGILLGQGISIKMLFISLAITAVFIFRDQRIRGMGLLVAFISMTLINLNDYFHIVTPWMFTNAQHELIKWLADGIIFIITCIAVLFFVQQNQRASENKTSFLRETNHEINKSLEAMMTTVNKYMHQSSDTVTVNMNDLHTIGIAARTMSDIVKAGLNLSKIEAGKYDNHEKEAIETRILLKEIINTYAPLSLKKGIGIKVDVNENVPEIFVSDKNKLITILSNILLNAIKFSYNDSLVEVNVNMNISGSFLIFQVVDFGKGIDRKRLSTIFDNGLYVSEKNELIQGYGVGMVLTKRYVDFLDGKISVESQEGKGTSFTVEIPVVFHESLSPDSVDLHKKSDILQYSSLLAGKSVLLVDDDPMTLEYGCQCFEMLGCTDVVMACNAEDGIQKAIHFLPDLILIDVQLPDRNGLEVVREIRHYELLPDVLIIVASSENSNVLREEAAAAGALLFLQKPYTLSDLKCNILKAFTIRI
ncbi:Signal transduction histidine kinase [Chitinophaga sp. CF118]|uniref:ATP-binding response regulator n=1 Tax=Chitinophaga sp. CF118 TaxID=1884367 RepID=UPI0008E981DB|nr:hybrid sensor histidine kinase/response regulator [Chitinophaga sp. CF118]SFD60940.1 Signal transduction histidine kinase [Chitinophaga sp. CF118]